MTWKRILTYATLGIIAGLLAENKTLRFSNDAGKTARNLKRNLKGSVRKAMHQFSH